MSGNHSNWNENVPSVSSRAADSCAVSGVRGHGSENRGSTGVDDDEGEEQEEPSSSLNDADIGDALASFREQWQRELEITPAANRNEPPVFKSKSTSDNASIREQWQRELEITPAANKNEPPVFKGKSTSDSAEEGISDVSANAATIESKAKCFFIQGIEHEKNGKLYEAIQSYRRAVQLVPDIEFRIYENTKLKSREFADTVTEESHDEIQPEPDVVDNSDSDDEDGADLMVRLQRVFSRSCFVCTPLQEQNTTHFSALPMEIILYILRWVVSSDLDMRSLELCSQVCRGFYICSRDPEIWRLACSRVWGHNCGGLTNYESWRHMFIERPRLHFTGCYISKTTYVRQGENSFQDQFYRPWHIVEYFRYLRFFPEGLVLMLTTSEDPQSSVAHLKQRTSRNSAILSGHYRLLDNRVMIVLRKQDAAAKSASNNRYRARKREVIDQLEQTYNLELQIQNYRSRTHAQLVWVGYAITTSRGEIEVSTSLDLPASRYPPFWFSRVKSYAAESEMPLQ